MSFLRVVRMSEASGNRPVQTFRKLSNAGAGQSTSDSLLYIIDSLLVKWTETRWLQEQK